MRYLTFLLAWRYLQASRKTTIGSMLLLSFVSIYLATAALALVTSIMQGFEQKTHETLKGIHADLIIHAQGGYLDYPHICSILEQEFSDIMSISPSDTQQALIYSNNDQPSVVAFKGIDPHLKYSIGNLETMLEGKNIKLSQCLQDLDTVLIGDNLAKRLKITIDQPLEIFTAREENQQHTLMFSPHTLIVKGIFKTGIEEVDSNLIVASLATLENVVPESGISAIHIMHNKQHNEKQLIDNLKKRFGLAVTSWKDMYPALVEALALEKYAMIIVLSLMVLVASMSIVSLLFMLITAKKKDQAILRAMGYSWKHAIKPFVMIGLIVSSSACSAGLLTAYTLGSLIQRYSLITLPDAYFVKYLPIVIEPITFGSIFIFLFIVSIIGCFLAVKRTKQERIVDLLREP